MFRHQGKSRTLVHNLQIAKFLSLVAGMVNATGFLEIHQLTTNVTGHFALFMYDLVNLDIWKGGAYLLYIFCFLFGSFVSGFLIEQFKNNKRLNVFVLPTLIESFILIFIPIYDHFYSFQSINPIAFLLLFVMGLQNSFVTNISNAVVRTTHLTGLFTDLGIELSQLFFPKIYEQKKIKATIKLRIYIISFFFIGGITGVFFYSTCDFGLNTLLISAFVLVTSLFYDDVRFRIILARRKFRDRKRQKRYRK
jgi:uncharacterized membrane protein YoaK (UPF0700 family)